MHIRWKLKRDDQEIVTFSSLSEEEINAHLRSHNVISMVLEFQEHVVGYILYELHKHRIDVLDLAVSPDFRRQGCGRALVEKLLGKLNSKRHELCIAVHDGALEAQLFLRSCGLWGQQDGQQIAFCYIKECVPEYQEVPCS